MKSQILGLLGFEDWSRVQGCRVLGLGCRVMDSGFRVRELGCGARDVGLRIQCGG